MVFLALLRYVPQPQPQEPFYSSYQAAYERYPKSFPSSDPYMRRDLNYHYRLPVQFTQNQYQKVRLVVSKFVPFLKEMFSLDFWCRYSHLGTPSRVKCCPFDGASPAGARSSPGSSSSASSVTSAGHASSLQDVQCQNYTASASHYQQVSIFF